MTVLIADDEKRICALVNHLIDWRSLDMKSLGFTHDGQTTLQTITELEPDIVIIDIRMPELSGLEVIKKVREQGLDTEFVVISGFKQFEYARQAMRYGISNYLLKPINSEELAYTLQDIRDKHHIQQAQVADFHHLQALSDKNKTIVRKNALHQLLNQTACHSLEQLNRDYYFQLQADFFQLVSLKIDGINQLGEHLPYFEQKLTYWLPTRLSACHDFEFVLMDGYFVLLLNHAGVEIKTLKNELKELLVYLQDQQEVFQHFSVTAAMGAPTQDLNQALRDLADTLQTLDQRLFSGSQKIYDIQPAQPEPVLPNALANLRADFLLALDIQDMERLPQLSSQIVDTLMDHRHQLSGHDALLFFKRCFNDFTLRLERHSQPEFSWLSTNDFFHQARQLGSLVDIEQLFAAQIVETFARLRAHEVQHETRPIAQAKAYIRQTFHLPITLEEVASHVGFSPSYLSTLFKSKTNETFSEYLLRKRMEAAKRALRDSNQTVAGICEQVGYTDIKHFTKSFKKFTGLLPKDYRKLYQ